MKHLQSSILLVVLLWNPVKGSKGDKSLEFRICMKECSKGCELDEYPGKLPIYLTMFWWDCSDECKYQCMHKVTESNMKNNKPIKQFYGKWPFVRFLGIQEPASVLFSIFNGVGHIAGWKMLKSTVPNTDYNMYPVWKVNVVISLNAWFWSVVFHTRDLDWTEKMDYFCATSLVMYSLFACLMRFIGLENKWSCFAVGLFLCCLFCSHVFYLAFIKFDYGYNMKFNVTIGIINMCSWLSWCYTYHKQQPYVWKCALVTVGIFLLLGLELGDFPPIMWTFDAHSLWHLGTAPFCYVWYSFLADDAKHQLSMKRKRKKSS
ncbi:GPI-specific phospholipase A2-like PGAP3 isoform X2 [Oculina patagonica]